MRMSVSIILDLRLLSLVALAVMLNQYADYTPAGSLVGCRELFDAKPELQGRQFQLITFVCIDAHHKTP